MSANLGLMGERIFLRPLAESDLDDYCSWYGDVEVTRLLGMKPLTRDSARALLNQQLGDAKGVYFSIVRQDTGQVIGYTFLAQIMRNHHVANEFGIVIGARGLWGQGYGSEATRLMLKYGFRELKLHKIQLLVLDFNERARRLYRRHGFMEEGILREARIVDGVWYDVVLMGILEHEYTTLEVD